MGINSTQKYFDVKSYLPLIFCSSDENMEFEENASGIQSVDSEAFTAYILEGAAPMIQVWYSKE